MQNFRTEANHSQRFSAIGIIIISTLTIGQLAYGRCNELLANYLIERRFTACKQDPNYLNKLNTSNPFKDKCGRRIGDVCMQGCFGVESDGKTAQGIACDRKYAAALYSDECDQVIHAATTEANCEDQGKYLPDSCSYVMERRNGGVDVVDRPVGMYTWTSIKDCQGPLIHHDNDFPIPFLCGGLVACSKDGYKKLGLIGCKPSGPASCPSAMECINDKSFTVKTFEEGWKEKKFKIPPVSIVAASGKGFLLGFNGDCLGAVGYDSKMDLPGWDAIEKDKCADTHLLRDLKGGSIKPYSLGTEGLGNEHSSGHGESDTSGKGQ